MTERKADTPADTPAPQKRAFIYCRTSVDSETQEDSTKVSIEEQEQSARELAQRNDYKVIDVFIDRNRSSKIYPTGFEALDDVIVDEYIKSRNIPKKERTRKALGDLFSRLNEIDIIIVRNVDRLMRSLELSKLDSHLLPMLRSRNILIHSYDDGTVNLRNSSQVLLFKIQNHVKAGDSEKTRKDTENALKELRRTGQLYFPPNFYGFRTDGNQKVKRVDNEITIVQRVFSEFLAGKTLKGIARDLNTERIPTLNPNRKVKNERSYWLDSTIRAMLKRPQYAGFQYKNKDGKSEVQVAAYQPPVIPYKTYKQVEVILSDRKKKNIGNTKDIHALSGLVNCGYCKYKLYTTATYKTWGGNKHKIESFRCITYTKTKETTQCKGIQIRERFTKGLEYNSGQPYSVGLEDCLFPLVYKAYINHLIEKKRRVGLDDEIDECKKKLDDSLTYRRNLGLKLRNKIMTDNSFDDLIRESEQSDMDVKELLTRLQEEAKRIDRVDIPKNLFRDYASHKIPNDLKRVLFSVVIDHVDVWHDHIDVYMKGSKPFQLERIRLGKTFVLPSARIIEINAGSRREIQLSNEESDIPISRVSYVKTEFTHDTHLDVVYMYDNDNPLHVIYGDENLRIFAEGIKNIPKSKT
jgi:DNA invertase Pin-like site-specific DNA recombinase